MLFNIGDYVTRNSYNNDMVFKIKDIDGDVAILEGFNVRLIADAFVADLKICKDCFQEITKDDRNLFAKMNDCLELERDYYFYLPGKVLHIDADKDYLDRCIKFYKDMNIVCYGVVSSEDKVHLKLLLAMMLIMKMVMMIIRRFLIIRIVGTLLRLLLLLEIMKRIMKSLLLLQVLVNLIMKNLLRLVLILLLVLGELIFML